MLSNAIIRKLAGKADIVFDQRLRGMTTTPTASGKRGKLEIPVLREFLFQIAPRIAQQWRPFVAPRYQMHLTSVLCHQKPMATYNLSGPGYGPENLSKLGFLGPWTCELADLLVVMEFRDHGRPLVLRQAGLIQVKDGVWDRLHLSDKEYKQHHILACLPEFTLPGVTGSQVWQLHGLAPGAAVYGVADPPTGTWSINRPDRQGPDLLYTGVSFGTWLEQLAAAADGAAADICSKYAWPPGYAFPPAWPYLVDDLLEMGKVGLFQGKPRRQSDLIGFMTAKDISLEGPEFDTVDSWMTFGECLPPESPDDEDGPEGLSILHIRFDPVEE
jgi:hypothetical protein